MSRQVLSKRGRTTGFVLVVVVLVVDQTSGVASILRTGLREIFVPKGLQNLAWGFYEAELVKAVLQKSIFLEYCLVWTAIRRQGTYAGSLVLDRHGARQEHRDDQVPKVRGF